MRRPPRETLAAAFVVALLALVAGLTYRPEPAPREAYATTDFGPDGYRAWAELLTREDVATSRFLLRPIELDARIGTLVAAPPAPGTLGAGFTAADLGALAGWVRAGGRLVYLGRERGHRDAERRLLRLPPLMPDVGGGGAFDGPLAARIRRLDALGRDRMLFAEPAGSAELSDRAGDVVVRYPLGRGEIVAVVDPALFTNSAIRTAGNARLAVLLAAPPHAGGVVAFDDALHGALIDRPWYDALPVPLRVTAAIAALALLLALIGAALPRGRPFRLEPPREPTSAEFLIALAALYERTRARAPAAALLENAAAVSHTPVTTDADLIASAVLAHAKRRDTTHDGIGDGRRAAFASRTRTSRRR